MRLPHSSAANPSFSSALMFCHLSTQRSPSRVAKATAAFTLIEMLTVIAIIVILMVLAVPSMVGSIGGSRITHGGETVMGAFSNAQSKAVGTNRPIEVRIYRAPSSLDSVQHPGQTGGSFRGILILEYYQPGEADPRKSGTSSGGGVTVLTKPLASQEKSGTMPE